MTYSEDSRFFDGAVQVKESGNEVLTATYPSLVNVLATKLKVPLKKGITKLASEVYEKNSKKPQNYWWLIARANGIKKPWLLDQVEDRMLVIPNLLDFKLKR